jgi:hypothetical protein
VPRDQAGVVGFETGAAKDSIVDLVPVEGDDPSIPYGRPLSLQLGKVTINRPAVSDRELPLPRLNRYLNAFCHQSHAIYHHDR